MSSVLRVLLLLGISGLVLSPIQSQSSGEGSSVRLDLPKSDKINDDGEEDIPEVIVFYDNPYEGEAFFFCCDHSSSMNRSLNGQQKLQVLKQELIKAVNQMSSAAEYSIIFFDASLLIFSEEPVTADPAGKQRGISWIMAVPPGAGTCLAPAGVRTIQIASRSTKRFRSVVILTDGQPWCNGTLTTSQSLRDITAANVQRFPIHTIAVPDSEDHEWNGDFLKQLAMMNGGTFRMAGQ